jgi:ribosomal protein S18 acetylase RimI-like enzyme
MNSPDFFRPGWVAPKNTSAIESAEIIGYLIYDFRKEIEKAADYIELLNIAVDIGHRGKHVGSKMVEFLVDRCKSYPDSLIALSVRVGNEQARGFFEKNGFEETEEEPDKFGSLSNENAVRVERIV